VTIRSQRWPRSTGLSAGSTSAEPGSACSSTTSRSASTPASCTDGSTIAAAATHWPSVGRSRSGPGIAIRASVDGSPLDARIILVANNHYTLDLLSLGEREQLDDGLLHLYAAGGLLPRTWKERTAPEFALDIEGGRVAAAFDGEPVELETPIRFRIEPRALRVLLPPPGA